MALSHRTLLGGRLSALLALLGSGGSSVVAPVRRPRVRSHNRVVGLHNDIKLPPIKGPMSGFAIEHERRQRKARKAMRARRGHTFDRAGRPL